MAIIEITESEKSELIQMALSDSISFKNIFDQYGLKEKETKKFMREKISPRAYKNWRKRVRTFSDRRENYK
tara:strand:+ start:180 stop:392 length:213 start_codon:yes stop_codon:yes gene_type:complete